LYRLEGTAQKMVVDAAATPVAAAAAPGSTPSIFSLHRRLFTYGFHASSAELRRRAVDFSQT